MQDINFLFSENLKRIRREKKITLEMAAAKSGVSRSMLGQIEKGDTSPSLTTVAKICAGLGLKYDEFVVPQNSERKLKQIVSFAPAECAEGLGKEYLLPLVTGKECIDIRYVVCEPEGVYKVESPAMDVNLKIAVLKGNIEIDANESIQLKSEQACCISMEKTEQIRNVGTSDASFVLAFEVNSTM